MESDPKDEPDETQEEFDPLLQQAERLPAFLRGSQGSNPDQHVRNADEDEGLAEESLDDGMGYEPPDPGKFTGD